MRTTGHDVRRHRRARTTGVASAALLLAAPLAIPFTGSTGVAGAATTATTATTATAVTTAAPNTAGAGQADEPSPGTPGVGDEVYPNLGNGGYDALQYDLDLNYQADSGKVIAETMMTAKATKTLSRFNLDAAGLDISAVRVNGQKVDHKQAGEELIITPAHPLPKGSTFVVQTDYTADPAIKSEDAGWVPTDNGFALAPQPAGAHWVFPSNDHPSDKANYQFTVTAPKGTIGVANGSLVDEKPNDDGSTSYVYRSRHPIATELVQVAVGDYEVVDRGEHAGVHLRDVVPTDRRKQLEPALKLTRGHLDWIRKQLGKFPHEAYGLLPVDTPDPGAFDFTGLETQTLTLYKPDYLKQAEDQIGSHMMHEITHTWFGNSVTPKDWSSLWINEGHADYYGLKYRYERGWPDSNGFTTFEQRMKYTYSLGDAWRKESGPVAKPDADNLFDNQRYIGGVLVLYALQQKVGEATFAEIEQEVLSRYAEKSLTTEDFIDVATEVAADDEVRPFLKDWLDGTKTPPMPGHPDWEVDPPKSVKRSDATPGPGTDESGEM